LVILGFSSLSSFKISLNLKGPLFLKKGLSIFAFNKAKKIKLSIIIAIYFLSTIVADQMHQPFSYHQQKLHLYISKLYHEI
jgi:hypothetical protein